MAGVFTIDLEDSSDVEVRSHITNVSQRQFIFNNKFDFDAVIDIKVLGLHVVFTMTVFMIHSEQ